MSENTNLPSVGDLVTLILPADSVFRTRTENESPRLCVVVGTEEQTGCVAIRRVNEGALLGEPEWVLWGKRAQTESHQE